MNRYIIDIYIYIYIYETNETFYTVTNSFTFHAIFRWGSSDDKKYYEKHLRTLYCKYMWEKCYYDAIMVVCLCYLQHRSYSHVYT